MIILASIFGFALAIGILVTFHEYGHYSVARALGVKVKRFSIGFGKPLWSKTAGPDNTEYVLAAIPLGGYVQMLDEREGEVDEAEAHRAFNRQSVWSRIAIVAAGPIANFLLAIVVFAVMYMVGVNGARPYLGEPEANSIAAKAGFEEQDLVTAVNQQSVASWQETQLAVVDQALANKVLEIAVVDRMGDQRLRVMDLGDLAILKKTDNPLTQLGIKPWFPGQPAIGKVMVGSAAERAGFQEKDVIIRINGESITTIKQVQQWIQTHPDQAIQVDVLRAAQNMTLSLIPARHEEQGKIIGLAGVQLGLNIGKEDREKMLVTVQYGVFDAFMKGVTKTIDLSVTTLRGIAAMITGEASLKNVSGPLMIAEVSGNAVLGGLDRYLFFLGLISLSIGILNLLPVPMLDGGHLLYYFVEAIKGSPVSEAVQEVGQRIGVVILLGLMSLAFFNDLSRLFGS